MDSIKQRHFYYENYLQLFIYITTTQPANFDVNWSPRRIQIIFHNLFIDNKLSKNFPGINVMLNAACRILYMIISQFFLFFSSSFLASFKEKFWTFLAFQTWYVMQTFQITE